MRILSTFIVFLMLYPCTDLAKKPKPKAINYLNENNPPSSRKEIDKTTIEKNNNERKNYSSNSITSAIKWTEHKRKHTAPQNIPWKRIVASTKNAPAKYRPNSPVEKIEREVWRKGHACGAYKIMAFDNIIGASKGEETPYVKVEYDSGTNTLHGHPITSTEYEHLMKKCN